MVNISAMVKGAITRVVLCGILLTPFSAQALEPIKILAYTDYPPYLYHKDGQQAGLYLRIVGHILKAIDQPYTIQTLPFKRGLFQAAAGDGIIIGILKTDERMETLDFSEPFYQERISVFFNKPKNPRITSVAELDGLTIGKLLGWSYGPEFDLAKDNNRFNTKNYGLESNFNMLSRGRLDAVIHTELSSAYVLNTLGLQDEIFLGSEPLALGNVHLAVKKGSHRELLERVNLILSEPVHLQEINRLIKVYKK